MMSLLNIPSSSSSSDCVSLNDWRLIQSADMYICIWNASFVSLSACAH